MMCGLKMNIKKQSFFNFPRGNKKSEELNQQVIITILIVILAILLIVFMIKACSMFKGKTQQVKLTDLEGEIKETVESLSSKFEAQKNKAFELPQGIDTVCFIDLSKSEFILDTDLANDYPLIRGSLESGDNKNMFLIQNNNVVASLDAGNICFENCDNFYSCVSSQDNILNIWFEGRTGCTQVGVCWDIQGEKDPDFYDNPLFLIQEKTKSNYDPLTDPTDIENWRELLTLVPLTLFNQEGELCADNEETCVFPYSIAYKTNNNALTDNDINNIITDKSKYNSIEKIYIFDLSYQGTNLIIQTKSTADDYFDFWREYSAVVIVDYDNYDSALIASLLAAYTNIPLIFIDDTHQNHINYITGKRVFAVNHDDSFKTNNPNTHTFIKDNCPSYYEISDTSLGANSPLPTFAELYSNIKIN